MPISPPGWPAWALWLPQYMALAPLSRDELVPVVTDWYLEPMPLSIVFPPNRRVSTKVRAFIDWVIALMQEHAPVITPPMR